jgi:hypothetical protein
LSISYWLTEPSAATAAEATFNDFFADIARKGHRVMNTKFIPDLDNLTITAIFTINSEPHPHKNYQLEKTKSSAQA